MFKQEDATVVKGTRRIHTVAPHEGAQRLHTKAPQEGT